MFVLAAAATSPGIVLVISIITADITLIMLPRIVQDHQTILIHT